MNMDTIGRNIILRIFGASHAPEIGCELRGIPAGTKLDMEAIRLDLARRSAANSPFATARRETDEPIVVSGVTDGAADGSPIVAVFKNRAYDRSEYAPVARPSHADYCAFVKSNGEEDISGGGKYSGRMTLPLVFAGAVCRGLLKERGVEVFSHVGAIGGVRDADFDPVMEKAPELDPFFPLVDPSKRAEMERALAEAGAEGDTLSCEAECAVTGLPVGLGEPLFGGLEGTLAGYLFMIPGLRGLEFGRILARGSAMNDGFAEGGRTLTNNSGGVNGGMANGMPLIFRVRFRPVPSIGTEQTGFDLIEKKPVPLTIKGRHDICILPRGLAAAEAAVCIAVLDLLEEGERAKGLAGARKKLDSIDAELMRLYAERMEVSREIGAIKRRSGLPTFDPAREAEVVSSRRALLPKDDADGGERLMRFLMEEAKLAQRRDMNLYLIGMPDCGKTRTGRKLKALLGMPLADTDRMIADREEKSIDAIFREDGEEHFRCAETELLRLIAARGGLIVATGGGMPMRRINADIMKNSGFTVFLDRKLAALHGQDTKGRPLIAAPTQEEVDANIDRLYHERRETYLAAADVTLDPDEPGAAERIAELFMRRLNDPA